MNNTKAKILKEKTKDEEGGIPLVCRLTKLGFLPKFLLVDVQVVLRNIFYKRLFLS